MNRADKRREQDELDAGREAGQSGDTQELDTDAEASDESVEELAEEDQAYEAEVVEGVEEAGDHPERAVRIREDQRPAHDSELPPDPDWK